MPLLRPIRRMPTWAFSLLLLAFALLALLEAFGPRGFSGRDELLVLQDMARRAQGPAIPAWGNWGNGCMLKILQSRAWVWSGDWRSLHVPVLLAIALEGAALGWLGCCLGGRAVAQGAILAGLLSATTLLHARSLLPFAILPALLCVSAALMLRGRWAALAGGLLLACGFLDYEGTVFALPGLAAMLALEPRLRQRHAWAPALLGFAGGLAAVLYYCRFGLREWWDYRLTFYPPFANVTGGYTWLELRSWLWGGNPEAYLGVHGHPVPALWVLPFLGAGLILQTRRRPWLIVAILAGLAGLMPASGAFEPQRTVAAFPALALAAGFGWKWAWDQARPRPALAWLLLVLPWLGLGLEQRALDRSLLLGSERYARSQAWMAVAQDPRIHSKVNAMLMPAGLAMESVMGPLQGPAQWVWLPGDLGEDAPPWKGLALYDHQGHLTGDALVQIPSRGSEVLLADLAFLRTFWTQLPPLRADTARACRQALEGPSLKTPVARASVWMTFIMNGVPVNAFTLADLQALDREAFKSPRFYRACTSIVIGKDLRLYYWLLWLLRRHAGAEKLSPGERDFLKHPWAQIPILPDGPVWPTPSLP
jgi:hypothetical protein